MVESYEELNEQDSDQVNAAFLPVEQSDSDQVNAAFLPVEQSDSDQVNAHLLTCRTIGF
jgi:hypothetical protein